MEVLMGPTFTIDPVYITDRNHLVTVHDEKTVPPGRVSVVEEEDSDDSSSIGRDSGDEDNNEENENDTVSNSISLSSLEDSLPIKRGLSNHYTGKSKSFANFSEIPTGIKDVAKTENPLNKRRRVIIASKWSRKSSFYTWKNPNSMPHLVTVEEDREQDCGPISKSSSSSSSNYDGEDDDRFGGSKLRGRKNLKSQSCFALSDLSEDVE